MRAHRLIPEKRSPQDLLYASEGSQTAVEEAHNIGIEPLVKSFSVKTRWISTEEWPACRKFRRARWQKRKMTGWHDVTLKDVAPPFQTSTWLRTTQASWYEVGIEIGIDDFEGDRTKKATAHRPTISVT